MQNRLLKLNKKIPWTFGSYLHQLFAFDSLYYNYYNLNGKFIESNSTRNKINLQQKITKTVGFKNSSITAMKLFNDLPNDLKKLDCTKMRTKNKLRKCTIENMSMPNDYVIQKCVTINILYVMLSPHGT